MLNENIKLYALQLKNGDITALEKLYAITYNRIYFNIFQIVKNREDAQDILQDTYIQAFSKIHTLRNTDSFYSWLVKIAVNMSKNYVKHNKTRIIQSESNTFVDSIITDDFIDIAEFIEKSETRGIILKLLDILPPEQKRVVLLYYYEGMKVSEIAEIEETSISTITSRLSYARSSLKKAISAYEKKHNISLHSGGLAITLYSALSTTINTNILGINSAVDSFTVIINALGLSTLVSNGVKYITSIDDYTEPPMNIRDKMKQYIRKRFIFEIKPFVVLTAILIVVSIFVIQFILNKTNELITNDSNIEKIVPRALDLSVEPAIANVRNISTTPITVSNFTDLKNAIYTGNVNTIRIHGSIIADSTIIVSAPITIIGGEITRYNNIDDTFYDGIIFNVTLPHIGDSILTLKNVVLDGKCYNEQTNKFIRESGSMINLKKDTSLILDGAVIKNNYSISENGSTITGRKVKLIEIKGGAEIKNCRHNDHGGAMSIHSAEILNVYDCTFTANISERSGGGIALYGTGTLNVDGAVFVQNKSLGYVCAGGAIATAGASILNIRDSIFKYNEAYDNGGIIGSSEGTEINITDSMIENNIANNHGGIIYADDRCKIFIDGNSKIISNSTNEVGGAIYAKNSEIVINDGVISNNSTDVGGVIFCVEGTVEINGGVITDNSADDGDNIYLKESSKLILNTNNIDINSVRKDDTCEIIIGYE